MTFRIHYKSRPAGRAPFLFVAHPDDNALFLSDDFLILPALSERSYKEFLDSYNAVISQMWAVNKGNFPFGFLPFSLRNTWQSSYYYGAESYARLSFLENEDIYFTSPHWFLWVLSHMDCDADTEEISRARRDICLSFWPRLLYKLRGLHFSFSHFSLPQPIPVGKRQCFFSVWTAAGAQKLMRGGDDPFYARLPQDIKDSVLVHHLEGPLQSPALSVQGALVVGRDTSFMRGTDWLSLFFNILFFHPKVPVDLAAPCVAILEDMARSASNQMVLALISYYAARRISAANPGIEFVTLYEGNCWEQGVYLAAEQTHSSVTALQHTAFSRGMLKMRGDTSGILPTHIITSGGAASDVLVHNMGHDKNRLYTGGRLRHEGDAVERLTAQGRKILVLLQGTPADNVLLFQLRKLDLSCDIVIRSHPGQPFDMLSEFEIAQGTLIDNLKEAALVLYNGTTAAFDALRYGVPCVYICCGDYGRYDPLFALDNPIKRNCCDMAILPNIIDDIIALAPTVRERGFLEAQTYIGKYFQNLSAYDYSRLIEYLSHD